MREAPGEAVFLKQPEAHEQTLRRYAGLLFDRATVDGLSERHGAWVAQLELLDGCAGQASFLWVVAKKPGHGSIGS